MKSVVKKIKMTYKGILIPIGGNEDKGPEVSEGFSLDFVNEGILSRVVSESGGVDSKIVVITTASRIPFEVGEMYNKAFNGLGCNNLEILHIQERSDAEKQEWVKIIKAADCVMFSGGDQSRIVDIIGSSTIHEVLMDRFINEKIVIAGTSAGAMAMSTEMISGGSSTEALCKGSVSMRDGMNFIPKLIIDTHFIQRGRFGRVANALARHPNLLGIGLAEDTGIIIENLNRLTVIGSGMVLVFDPNELTHNNEAILPEGTPMTIANLTVHILASGDSFTIDEKKVEALSLEAYGGEVK